MRDEKELVIEICNLLLNVGTQAEYLRHVHLNMIDYSGIILSAYKASENMTGLILIKENRCLIDDNGMIISDVYESKSKIVLPVNFALRYAKDCFPAEILQMMDLLRQTRNQAAHTTGLSKDSFYHFCTAFDRYFQWFLHKSRTVGVSDYNIDSLLRTYESARRYFNPGIRQKEEEADLLKEIAKSISIIRSDVQDLKIGQEEIKGQLTTISQQIRFVSERINDYQLLVEKQINRATSREEVERIMDSFSEECTHRIVKEIKSVQSNEIYLNELNSLKELLGLSVWNKMSADSQTFLVTAKVSFKTMLSMEGLVDYSGVCLLVTKALEYELKKRFYTDYLNYMRIYYPGEDNYSKYPTSLMKSKKQVLPPEKFTLGSIAYVLGYSIKPNEPTDKTINNQDKLVEYCQAKLFAGKKREEILSTLLEYAETIEKIRNDFRNPSAHVNAIQRENAEDCINLVIDIEKFLKKILESFDR